MVYLFPFFNVQLVINFAAALLLVNSAAFREYLNMFGYGLPAAAKVRRDGIGGKGAKGKQHQYGPAGRVGYGLVNITSGIHLQLFDCKYLCNYSVAQIFFEIFSG